MKKIIPFLIVVLFASEGFAVETLFSGDIKSGGYGGPGIKFTTVRDEFGLFVGGQGGWIINHNFVLGGGGYGLSTEHHILDDDGNEYRIDFGYGGVLLEYIAYPEELIHFYISTLFAGGGMSIGASTTDNVESSTTTLEEDAFFVLEPGVHGEVNITKWFRLAVGVEYRWVAGLQSDYLSDSDFSNVSTTVTFRFGSF